MKISRSITNPYFRIGYAHNNGLDYIGQNLIDVSTVAQNQELIVTLSSNFVKMSGTFVSADIYNIEAATLHALNYIATNKYPTDFTELQISFAKDVEAIFDNNPFPFRDIDTLNQAIEVEV